MCVHVWALVSHLIVGWARGSGESMIEPQGPSSVPYNLGVLSSTHAVEAEEQRLKVPFGSLAWTLSQKVKGRGREEMYWLSFVF